MGTDMTDTRKPTSEKEKNSVAKASIKEAIGKLTGDVKVEAEGKAEKISSESEGTPEGKSGSARSS
ncbi:hypothetical protein ASF52_13610 [Methylobacterium sp. Leaf112]|nr:hypothetical protein ASF25_03475 [Methylobacterium sp. Leaf100]KQP58657.1 hypothetical protein ASF52_13610 [Methylobacterium sp. Leaf112]